MPDTYIIMQHVTVVIGLDRLSDPQLLEKGRNHVAMVAASGDYDPAAIGPRLADLTKACDELEESITTCMFYGGRVAFEQKRTRRRTLYGLIKSLAGFVQAHCGNDRNQVVRAGFRPRESGRPVDSIDMPHGLRTLLTDRTGTVLLRWGHVKHAKHYIVFMNPTPDQDPNAWVLVGYSSRAAFTVEGLETVRSYHFRVQAIGRKGLVSPMSDAVKGRAA